MPASTSEYLVKSGTDLDASDDMGWTALMQAASFGHLDVVKLLVDCGADANVADLNGLTALSVAAKSGHLEVQDWLS